MPWGNLHGCVAVYACQSWDWSMLAVYHPTLTPEWFSLQIVSQVIRPERRNDTDLRTWLHSCMME
ncbi:hypothetical protein COMA2_70147 [Candidatus Nitrospira nitrificans]|uniref:Uncharacterized protein n=1 Tax=Candidatus Nitrospira nitrificans TaxID=1742973 RepID=A0A0S4LU80_9BACT|nr:hypothetical protein COMA2_70147 [Candidatus Nitrospira nitrificans]